jgi:hypothetical protein
MSKTKTIDWPFIISLCNEENKPLAGIPVWIGPRFVNTDLKGEALFLGLEPGDYELGIDAADFRPLRKKIKIDRKIKNLGFILQGFATGGIKGNVRLSVTGFSLPDAEIKLTAAQPEETGAEEFSFWTDWDGNYSSGYIPVGEYGYHVNASLCQPKQGRLKIEKDTVLTLDVDLKPVPDPAKITVNVKTVSGVKVEKSRVRLLEGMGVVTEAEKDGTDTCIFTDIDRAPFNQVQLKEKPFISRNFVVAVDILGYHTGYATGSLRSGKECETVVMCRKITTGELVIKGIEESQPPEVPLDEAMKVQIPCEKKERFFKISLPHPGNVHVKAGPNPYNTFLRILDKDLNLMAEIWNYANQPMERTVQSGTGELLIGISGEIRDVPEVFSALIVNYQPVIDPYQPNNTFESALPVAFGEIIRPFTFPQDDANYFMVAVKRPGILRARLTGCVIHARIRILNPLAEEIVNTWNYANQPIDASCPVYKPGLYRIALSGTNPGDYTLAPANLKIDFMGTESSPEEFAPETAPPKPVPTGKRFGGTLFPGGKYSLYRFNVDRTGFIKIRFQLSDCHSRLRVMTGKGKEIYSAWNYAGQSLNSDIAIHESGEYFIEVSGTDPSQQSLGSFFIGVFFYPNDEYEGYKGNDSLETAAEIHVGQEVVAAIERPGDIDYYRFYVDHPGLLIQYTRTFPIPLHFIVSDPQGKEIFNSWNYAGQNLDREYHVLNCGYHTLRVLGTNPNDYSPASYGFRFELSRVKPESVQVNNKLVLNLNSGIKLDALIPGAIKSFMLPVTTPQIVTIGVKIPIHAKLIIIGPDSRELHNSWNYSGQPLETSLKLNDPTTLQCTVQGTNPGDWSKECYYIYATDGGAIPPEPIFTLETIFEDNRTVIFNVAGASAGNHTITKYELDFEGNGKFQIVEPGQVEHKYKEGKLYCPRLLITDEWGAMATESMFLDLIDVTLSGMSCCVVFPQNGAIVSAPGIVFAQASSGPGKPVKGMKLYLDGRLLAGCDLTHIEAELAWKSLASGGHTIKVAAFSTDDKEVQDTVTFKMSDVFDLWPEDGKIITGSRAVISWFSPIIAATRVEYRKAGKEKWEKAEGQKGKQHRVVLEGLDPGIPYEFRAGDGNNWSETRSLTLQKGLSFERPRYGVTIPREYGQSMPITVRNNSDHPLEVVLECLPPDDKELLVGFVGEGSEDRPIQLPPGEMRQYMLALSAQDCIRELHRFLVRIRSKDGYSDQAEVEVRVKIPRVDLQWEELETNPNTLSKKLRLVNKGDGLTDLTLRAEPAGAFRLRPSVEHALLEANASQELWVDPVLFDGFKSVNGEVKIETFGKTFSHKLECAVPEGMTVYQVRVK